MINISWAKPAKREVQVGAVSHGTFITHLATSDKGSVSACTGDAGYHSVYRVFEVTKNTLPGQGILGQRLNFNIPDNHILLENIEHGTFRAVKQTRRCAVLVRPELTCREAVEGEIDDYLSERPIIEDKAINTKRESAAAYTGLARLIVSPNHCSKVAYQELQGYLNDQGWEYTTIKNDIKI